MQQFRRLALALLISVALGTSACSGGVRAGGATVSPSTGAAPARTSPTAGPPSPTDVPQGWQSYNGPHFTIAYPSGWDVITSTQANSTPDRPNVTYQFAPLSAGGGAGVTVNEQDGWDAATIQSDFCASQAQVVTLAGLQMRYQVGAGGAGRDWLFATDKGTVYGLATMDGFASQDVQVQDDAVLATFRPEYTKPSCA